MQAISVQRADQMTLAEFAEMSDYVSLVQFAQAAEVSEKTIRRWGRAGIGPVGYRVGRQWRFKTSEVLKFLEGKDAS
ncbi:helix-turn-helix domain-containing protein [Nocardia cyriacigeorgica]|uniref:helix-turn-helix domain-containing protein n=1 Tax=Nocardia cyriacigeorgica TaxID=135487 RepID=UPI0034DAFDD6